MESHVILATRSRAGCQFTVHRTGRMTVSSDNRLALAPWSVTVRGNEHAFPRHSDQLDERKVFPDNHLPSASRLPPENVSRAGAPLSRTIKTPPLGSKPCPLFFSAQTVAIFSCLADAISHQKQRASSSQMTAARKTTQVSPSPDKELLSHPHDFKTLSTGVLR